ncbi:phosphoesterase, PA-phosphatase related [Serinicoccus hydrothermalis]|uniref:Phosphoesterase, PA-phosphatase related n=1 Tax=Serinicoccus hydrothermalis TaxID=1758689 RepID=A0A1B1N8I2_9MICO|nr:phosphatase PAP2 family protein [Serinicoccus hydrothermalis]ANS77743.1 phosphoesterase, PA-phosphatase related [Serinicoccus hydrothermalis]
MTTAMALSGGPSTRPPARTGSWLPWLLVVGAGVGFVLLYAVAVLTTSGQRVDTAVMDALTTTGAQHEALDAALPDPYLLLALALGAGLLGMLGRVRAGLAVLVSVPLLVGATQVLKAVLPRPQLADPWVMANSLPSGHTGAAAALALALLLVVPRRWLPVAVVLGVALTTWMGALVVMLGYHRPSDVLASVLLALGAGGVGLLVRGDGRRERLS